MGVLCCTDSFDARTQPRLHYPSAAPLFLLMTGLERFSSRRTGLAAGAAKTRAGNGGSVVDANDQRAAETSIMTTS